MGSSASATRQPRPTRGSMRLAATGTRVHDTSMTSAEAETNFEQMLEPFEVECVTMGTRRPTTEPSSQSEGGYFFATASNGETEGGITEGHKALIAVVAFDSGNHSDNKDTSIASRNSLRSSVVSHGTSNAFGMPLVIPVQQHLSPCEDQIQKVYYPQKHRNQNYDKLDDDRPLPLTTMSANSLATESSSYSNKAAPQDSVDKHVADAGFTPWGKPLGASASVSASAASGTTCNTNAT